MLSHAATLLLSVGDIMGFNSPEQFTSHSPLPVDGGERKFVKPPRRNGGVALELAFRARLPGHTHLQLHELNPTPTRTPE